MRTDALRLPAVPAQPPTLPVHRDQGDGRGFCTGSNDSFTPEGRGAGREARCSPVIGGWGAGEMLPRYRGLGASGFPQALKLGRPFTTSGMANALPRSSRAKALRYIRSSFQDFGGRPIA